ncbi:hypothetical protein CRG98_041365 [Punica granatum]|uniref:Uncharacterized protein n=1 Tax=Punica granatum TaxID=22663 RepID=A0A2I0I2P0_PUNGR|nr:hypothetical protein CRG98_041365 [Punica granatum]
MINKRKAGFTKKAEESNQKNKHTTSPENSRDWHCGTIHHRITEASKGAQYGTLKIPLGAKVTNDMSGRASEASYSSRDTPDLSQTPLLTGLPGPDPLTRFPEGRFSGHKRLPANFRGTFMENKDHSDPRTPRDT